MTQKILCAIDNTDHAKPAIDMASDMAKRLGVPLTFCTVNVLTGGMRGPAIYMQDDSVLEKALEAAVATARKAGTKEVHSTLLKARDVAVSIVQYADQNGFDHIVTGTGGKGSLTRFALGSVATDVMNRAHCPVTIAR